MIFTDSYKLQIEEYASHYVDIEIEPNLIWDLCEKGFLYDLFKYSNLDGHNLSVCFFEVVESVLNKKLARKKYNHPNLLLKGKWLLFDPASTMFDGVAETQSNGFFDSDDVPPPEFWVGYVNQVLVSFIPNKFLDLANLGVDSCISGSLYWGETRK